MRFLIVGGGIAGVACAEELIEQLESPRVTRDHPELQGAEITLLSAAPVLKVPRNVQKLSDHLVSFDIGEESVDEVAGRLQEKLVALREEHDEDDAGDDDVEMPAVPLRPSLEELGGDRISVRVIQVEAERLDTAKREILASDGRVFPYDRLCIATGARPRLLVEGDPRVIGIRDTESVEVLLQRLSSARRVMVVGNGGIALELVFSLASVGQLRSGVGSASGSQPSSSASASAAEEQQRQVIWAIKDAHLGNTFLDRAASAFVLPFLFQAEDPAIDPNLLREGARAAPASASLQPEILREHPPVEIIRQQQQQLPSQDQQPSQQGGEPGGSAAATVSGAGFAGHEQHQHNERHPGVRGGSLGPTWLDHLKGRAQVAARKRQKTFHAELGAAAEDGRGPAAESDGLDLQVEFGTWVRRIWCPPADGGGQHGGCDSELPPLTVELSNGRCFQVDLLVSATGVIPNTEWLRGSALELADGVNQSGHQGEGEDEDALDGGIVVDHCLQSTAEHVFAAGDAACCRFVDLERDRDRHWFQMRLWTQARVHGAYAAQSMLGLVDPEDGLWLELFTHVTQFFGQKVVLLGRFNGQGLPPSQDQLQAAPGQAGSEGEVRTLMRVDPGREFIKVILYRGRAVGAVLIGDTELEETLENLILNQLDLSRYGDDLLREDVDLEDFFD